MKALQLLPYVLAAILGAAATIGIVNLTRPDPVPCPACNCPAAVSLQNFDLDKLNNKKGTFNYSPQLNGVTIELNASDSVLLKNAIQNALQKLR